MPSPSPARGARVRICVHCSRTFRRTEHLERHIRTRKLVAERSRASYANHAKPCSDTKEKPFSCFCGAAFTRRDLLKRHTRISHQDDLTSPSAPEPTTEADFQPTSHPAVVSPQYSTPTTSVIPLAGSSGVHQWAGPQTTPYLDPNHSGDMVPAAAAGPPNSNIDSHSAMVADPDMLQAAQLLLPGDYRPTGMFHPCVFRIPSSYLHETTGHDMIVAFMKLSDGRIAQPMPYLPEDLNHFQEFTHFLDSIGLPGEWLPSEGETSQTQDLGLEDVRNQSRPVQEQHSERPRGSGEGSRGDSPFRSWLPSIPKGDQSLGNLSDSGIQSLCGYRLSSPLTAP